MPCARHFYVYLPPDASLRCLGTRLLSLIPTVAAGLNRRAFGLPSPRIRGLGPRATRTAVLGAGHLAKLEPRQSREIGFYEAVRALLQISPTRRRTGGLETYTPRARGRALVLRTRLNALTGRPGRPPVTPGLAARGATPLNARTRSPENGTSGARLPSVRPHTQRSACIRRTGRTQTILESNANRRRPKAMRSERSERRQERRE
jgi:hypothetical protein